MSCNHDGNTATVAAGTIYHDTLQRQPLRILPRRSTTTRYNEQRATTTRYNHDTTQRATTTRYTATVAVVVAADNEQHGNEQRATSNTATSNTATSNTATVAADNEQRATSNEQHATRYTATVAVVVVLLPLLVLSATVAVAADNEQRQPLRILPRRSATTATRQRATATVAV